MARFTVSNPGDLARVVYHLGNMRQPFVVDVQPPKRSLDQNARFWAVLGTISRQATHNGRRYTPDQWKALFMHACGHEMLMLEGLNGEAFPAGFRSSRLTVSQMNDLMTFIDAWAAERGIDTGDAAKWEAFAR